MKQCNEIKEEILQSRYVDMKMYNEIFEMRAVDINRPFQLRE